MPQMLMTPPIIVNKPNEKFTWHQGLGSKENAREHEHFVYEYNKAIQFCENNGTYYYQNRKNFNFNDIYDAFPDINNVNYWHRLHLLPFIPPFLLFPIEYTQCNENKTYEWIKFSVGLLD